MKLLILITKIKELNPSKDCVFNIVAAIVVVVVTISLVSHQTKVCQGSDGYKTYKY